jgi:hypothetical protein
MSAMSKELKDALVALLPPSRTKRLLLMAQPVPQTANLCDAIIASLPKKIVEMHRCRQDYVNVCELVHTKHLGFEFPGWRERYTTAGKEPKPSWLIGYAKRLWDYCESNDLRPALVDFGQRWHFPNESSPQKLMYRCELIIRPQLSQLDALLGHLQLGDNDGQPPVAPGDVMVDVQDLQLRTRDAEAAFQTEAQRALEQFHREMDEAGAQAALPLVKDAIAAMKKAADARQYCAEILHSGVGYPGYGTAISTYDSNYSDPRLFDFPNCWEGVVARGMGNWALAQGLSIDYQITKNRAGGNQACFLRLVVSWHEKRGPAAS